MSGPIVCAAFRILEDGRFRCWKRGRDDIWPASRWAHGIVSRHGRLVVVLPWRIISAADRPAWAQDDSRRRPPVAPGRRAQGGPAGIAVLCPAFREAADSGLRPRPSADGYRLLGTPSHAIATSWHQGFPGQGARPVCVRAAYPGRGSHHSRGGGRRCMPGSRMCPLATSQNGSFIV